MSKAACPSCGYTKKDAQIHGDHNLCKNTGKAPWEKVRVAPSRSAAPNESTLELAEGILRDFGKSNSNSEAFEHQVANVQKRIRDWVKRICDSGATTSSEETR